jgi:citrate lyase subunit beta/citryl-CoA lyase
MRSLLFVPGDSPAKLAKAMDCGADALLIDLEDSVAPEAKSRARDSTSAFLAQAVGQTVRPKLYVRVNGLATGLTDADLDRVMAQGPDGIMLPKAHAGADIQHLAAKLAVREAEYGLPDGHTRILAIATETARSLFQMGSYRGASHRLEGLAWGAEDLAADLGAQRNRLADGSYGDPFRLARALLLLAASAAEVIPIDAVYPNFRDLEGLRAEALAGHLDGFTAKMAIHPAQVAIINEVLSPSAEAIDRAQQIIAAFAANPGAGVIGLHGEMLDCPHLTRAERLLARAQR